MENLSDKPKAIVLLAHQGLSYLPDISEACTKCGLRVLVVSSWPQPMSTIREQSELYEAISIVDEHNLAYDNVEPIVRSFSVDFYLVGAISTFEGYRLIMAQVNQLLGVVDCSSTSLKNALDKSEMRKILRQNGLSKVDSWILSQDQFDLLKTSGASVFIKPRSGVGSFGCFRMDAKTTWAVMEGLSTQLNNDDFLKAAYLGNYDFIAEEYIPGIEFSFEIVACDKEYYTLAVHEKANLEARDNTILENVDVSPSLTLETKQLLDGSGFVARCLQALELYEGAFHVEARFDENVKRWEIIEVNPRIGGGFINHSVKEITEGISILDAWLAVLIRQSTVPWISLDHFKKLQNNFSQPKNATIGHYVFGEPSKTLRSIELKEGIPEPKILNTIAKVGDTLPELSREIQVIEGMWSTPISELRNLLDVVNSGWVEVVYES